MFPSLTVSKSSSSSFEGFHGDRSEQSPSTGSRFIMYIASVDGVFFYFSVSSRWYRFDEQIGAIPWGEWKMTTLHLDLYLDLPTRLFLDFSVICVIWFTFYWKFRRREHSGKTLSASIAQYSLSIARFFFFLLNLWCIIFFCLFT